jgi:hypothetical protein
VRTTPIIGKKAWFGPRGWGGWGWAPVSWEGWAALVLILGPTLVLAGSSRGWSALTAALLGLVCILKGTSPGGSRRRKEFLRTRAREGLVRGGGDDTPSIEEINRHFDQRDNKD